MQLVEKKREGTELSETELGLQRFLTEVEILIDDFLAAVDVAETTKKTYEQGLDNFFNWFENQAFTPRELRQPAVKTYKEELKANYAANTASTYIVALRRFFEWAVSAGYLPYNPAENIKGCKASRRHLREDLSKKEVEKVASLIDVSTEKGARDFAMLVLMLETGLRISEVKNADIGDITVKNGRKLLFVKGKGRDSKDEWVTLNRETEDILSDYLSFRTDLSPEKPLFTGAGNRNRGNRLTTDGIRKALYKYFRQAGVKRERVTIHSLRHTFVTSEINEGADLVDVQQAARHVSIETTRGYFHEANRLDNPVNDRLEGFYNFEPTRKKGGKK